MNIVAEPPVYGKNYNRGSIGFIIRKRDFVSWGIRWFEKWDTIPWAEVPSPSHTFVITGEDSTEEAFGNGVHAGSLSAYWNDPNVALLVRTPARWTPELADTIVQEALSYDGQAYAYWQIGAMAAANSYVGHVLNRLFRGHWSRTLEKLADSKRSAICSEVVAAALLKAIGRTGCLTDADPWNVNPAMLFWDTSPSLFEPGAIELLKKLN